MLQKGGVSCAYVSTAYQSELKARPRLGHSSQAKCNLSLDSLGFASCYAAGYARVDNCLFARHYHGIITTIARTL